MFLIWILIFALTPGASAEGMIISTAPAFISINAGTTKDIAFSTRNYLFPKSFEQPIVGDITNSGRDEVIALYHYRDATPKNADPSIAYGLEFGLAIYSIEKRGLKLLWDDGGRLGFGCCGEASGQDSLEEIGDTDGSGRNRLIVELQHSDVSYPYGILSWQKDHLKQECSVNFDTYRFANAPVALAAAKGLPPVGGSVGQLTFAERNGKKFLKAKFQGVIGRPPNETKYGFEGTAPLKDVYGHIKNCVFVIEEIP